MVHHGILPTVRAAIAASALLAAPGGVGAAGAMPFAPAGPAVSTGPAITLAADGCGPGFFRTLAGQCFPNRRFVGPFGGVRAPPPCPPGYLRAPDRPLCFPFRR